MKKILILTLSETSKDPRILRFIDALHSRGHEIRVVCMNFYGLAESERCGKYQIDRLPVPRSYSDSSEIEAGLDDDLIRLIKAMLPGALTNPKSGLARFVSLVTRRLALPIVRKLVGEAVMVDSRGIGDLFVIRQNLMINARMAIHSAGWATHVYANDLETLTAGVALKRKERIRLIYDAHEIWPQQWKAGVVSPMFVGFHETLERHLLGYVDTAVTVCGSIANYYHATCPGCHFEVVHSAPSRLLACEEDSIRPEDPFTLYYHGIYNQGRGLETVVLALPELEGVDFYVRAVGDISPLREFVREKGLSERVHFLDPVPVAGLISAASGFTVGVCPFLDDCLNTHFCLPNKFFEYMLAGCAICSSDLVEMKSLLEKHGVGIVHSPGNVAEFVSAINSLRASPDLLFTMRKKARKLAVEELCWEENASVLNRILDSEGL